jgi:hypothetical protein
MPEAHDQAPWPRLGHVLRPDFEPAASTLESSDLGAGSPAGTRRQLFPEFDRPLEPGDRSAIPALLSAVVPGTGQMVLGQRRGWVYLALEAMGWIVHADRRSSGARYRDAYRDLAWESARVGSDSRIDPGFAYYETLTYWTRSGAFDVDPTTVGVQPESDPATFNGSIWARARAVYGVPSESTDPGGAAYGAALAYYQARAYGTDFLWDWSADPDQQRRFSDLIGRSDERYRQATIALGVVIANHMLAAADAFVATRSVRLDFSPGVAGAWDVAFRWEGAP